ncbi:MAG: hypothetical protein ABI970_16415 [Chloroflexota bacterium]
MSDKQKNTKSTAPPTLITLTLPSPSEGGLPLDQATATLLIQRGDLAHMRQFTYVVVDDMTTAIKKAYIALASVEAEPPVIPDLPKDTPKPEPKVKPKAEQKPVAEEEPTIDIPLKKGMLAVKISHLKIVGGETDAAAYRQAVLIGGKLIDGKLWDGQSPIRIDDVYAVQRKLKHLSDAEMSLFALEDFVQMSSDVDIAESVENDENDAVETDDNGMEIKPLLITGSTPPNGEHTDDSDDE